MGKPIYRKLIITALVTSMAFGGFLALNFYALRQWNVETLENKKMVVRGHGKPGSIKVYHPGAIPLNNDLFILNNGLYTVSVLLLLWLLNISILLAAERTGWPARTRTLLRYLASYAVIILLVILYTHIQSPNQVYPPPYGVAARGGNRIVSSAPHLIPTPTFRFRFEGGQISLMAAVVLNTIVLAILQLILVQHHKSQVELENTRLKMNDLLARHQHLKHQLHPHFLFNSLHTLKALIKKSPDTAEQYLVRLSVLMRSSLSRNELHLVSLAEELQLCIDYMEMQQIRFGKALHYEIQIPEPVRTLVTVPAFSLQLLAENALKHNTLTTNQPLTIVISYSEDGYITVTNNKQLKAVRESSTAIGLNNLSQRYILVSGHDIVVMDNENDFTVKLKALPA
jgi:two-component system, LytTR family, sensor kinase